MTLWNANIRRLSSVHNPSGGNGNKFTHREHDFHSTTMLSVRKGNKVAVIADGQISLGPTVFKNTARKIRKIQDNVVCGFAGSAADCLALLELLEKEFEKYPGQTLRACLSLAKQWRTSKCKTNVVSLSNHIFFALDRQDSCLAIG